MLTVLIGDRVELYHYNGNFYHGINSMVDWIFLMVDTLAKAAQEAELQRTQARKEIETRAFQ